MITENDGTFKIEIELKDLGELRNYQEAILHLIQQATASGDNLNDSIHDATALLEATLLDGFQLHEYEKLKKHESQQLKKAS